MGVSTACTLAPPSARTHIVVPHVGEKSSGVGQQALEVLAADIWSDEGTPVSRTGAIELEDEVENCG